MSSSIIASLVVLAVVSDALRMSPEDIEDGKTVKALQAPEARAEPEFYFLQSLTFASTMVAKEFFGGQSVRTYCEHARDNEPGTLALRVVASDQDPLKFLWFLRFEKFSDYKGTHLKSDEKDKTKTEEKEWKDAGWITDLEDKWYWGKCWKKAEKIAQEIESDVSKSMHDEEAALEDDWTYLPYNYYYGGESFFTTKEPNLSERLLSALKFTGPSYNVIKTLTFTAREHMQTLQPHFQKLAKHAKFNEPDTIAHHVLISGKNPLEVLVVARYRDNEQAVSLHRNSAPFKNHESKLQALVDAGHAKVEVFSGGDAFPCVPDREPQP